MGPGRDQICRCRQISDAGAHQIYFDGRLFAGQHTTEFELPQRGVADFAIGTTINWSPQVKELNLFCLPFLLPSYKATAAEQPPRPRGRL